MTRKQNDANINGMTDLKSSVGVKGKTVTQIITFKGGVKKTIEGVVTKSIKQGEFTKFHTLDGRYVMINDDNVLCVEVFAE
jgi:hypothetical protein